MRSNPSLPKQWANGTLCSFPPHCYPCPQSNFGDVGQEDDHAADDAEAHDETYLIPDAENAASEATDEPGKGPSQVQRSATPERHTGTDAIAVADGEANLRDQVHDVAMSPKRNCNDAEPKSSSQQAHNKSGTIGPSVAFMEAGNNSDDSLSLSE